MIIIIEGSQGSGKSHMINLLKNRFKLDNNILFYKYGHVNHMKNLEIEDIEPRESFHYFTISNTLTILELHKTILKDKVIVFDRGIFSAYAWSIMRKRLNAYKLEKELSSLLDNPLYNDCHVIRIVSEKKAVRAHSDIFDKFTNDSKENFTFNSIFEKNMKNIQNTIKNNSYTEVINKRDKISEVITLKVFNKLVYENNINKLK